MNPFTKMKPGTFLFLQPCQGMHIISLKPVSVLFFADN